MHGKGFASVTCPHMACFQQLYVRRREARKRFCEHEQKKGSVVHTLGTSILPCRCWR